MRINWNYIKGIVLFGLVVFLFAFSSAKNGNRKVTKPIIEFVEDQKPFITHATVSKLLIQNQQPLTNVPKETLDLNRLESALNTNAMIEKAEVYLNINGNFSAIIKQKKPIARVLNSNSYYIDSNGGNMPLSSNFTARVPIVTGEVSKKTLDTVYIMARKIDQNEFLKKNVVEIIQNKDRSISLKLRQCNFLVHIGSLEHLDKKVNNLRAFLKKAIKDKSLDKYSKVNLQFENQVVCTKV